MKKSLILLFVMLPLLCMAQREKFTQENFEVETNVVEVFSNKMSLDIKVNIQPNFFGKNTLAKMTPVFRWGMKEIRGNGICFQGEMVDDNCRIVGYKLGVTESLSLALDYVRGMEDGKFFVDVELSSASGKRCKLQEIELPVRIDKSVLLVYETVKDADFYEYTIKNGNGGLANSLFYRAQNSKNVAERMGSYDQALVYMPGDYHIMNNLALCYLERGDVEMAEKCLSKALDNKPESPEVNANMCLLSVLNGDLDKAQDYLAKADSAKNYAEAFGTVLLAKGQLTYAAAKLKDVPTNTGILANVLNQNYATANKLIDENPNKNGMTFYLQALLGVKSQNRSLVGQALGNLMYVDPRLYGQTKNDPEFAEYKDLFKRPY